MTYPPQGPPPGYGQQGYSPQPAYGQTGYGQPYQAAYPGYSHEGYGGTGAKPARSNPVAALLTLIGGLGGIAVGVMPVPGGDMRAVVAAWNMIVGGAPYHNADEYGGGTELMLFGIAIFATVLGGVIALIASFPMFAKRPNHRGVGGVALVGALLMLAGAAIALIISEGAILDSGRYAPWIMLLCGIPALIGALIALARK